MDIYAEPIFVEVRADQPVLPAPRAFVWRGQRYEVVRLLELWTDAGRADRSARRHGWWERHHRNYFRVETQGGETWDLYLDRSGGRRMWFVSRRWNAGESPSSPEE
ncbi:MAG TPA: DUF6504 family protein [Armatimonadota bacterium]|jgi:hypothetical protein